MTKHTRQYTPLFLKKPGALAMRRDTTIDTIVVHYTATQDLSPISFPERGVVLCDRAAKAGNLDRVQLASLRRRYAEGSCIGASDAAMLCLINSANKARTASWHYCIGSKSDLGYTIDAEVIEYVPPELQAHHVGALNLRTNRRSIGIECCYPGPAPRRECPTVALATAWYAKRGWETSPIFRRKDPTGLWRYWAPQPFVQAAALRFVCLSLCAEFPTINAICSHHLFAPKKRIDPDPPIDLAELRRFLSNLFSRPFYDKPQG